MTITTIIFDFGGVLIDWNPRYLYRRYFSSSEAMESFLAEIDFSGWNYHLDKGRPFIEGVRELTAQFPQHHALIHAYHENWEDSLGDPIPGSLDILRRIKLLGYSVFGLSNWSLETFPRAQKRFDFFSLLDGYLLSGEAGVNKPDPSIFRLALEKFHRRAEECLFIDDSPANIKTALGLGFTAIQFQDPAQLEREMEHLGILARHL